MVLTSNLSAKRLSGIAAGNSNPVRSLSSLTAVCQPLVVTGRPMTGFTIVGVDANRTKPLARAAVFNVDCPGTCSNSTAITPEARVKIFYGANATIRAFPLSGSHITRFSMCALSFPNRISTGIGKIQATPTLRGANERSRTATYSPNPLLPLDLHYSIRNVHPEALA